MSKIGEDGYSWKDTLLDGAKHFAANREYIINALRHTSGNSIIIVENEGLFFMLHGDITYIDEALYENKLSVVFEDISAARETPTVLAEVDFQTMQASGKYVCSICGYVYDPAEHDGAAFEDLPDDWKCQRCKQGKDKFNKA